MKTMRRKMILKVRPWQQAKGWFAKEQPKLQAKGSFIEKRQYSGKKLPGAYAEPSMLCPWPEEQ